MGSYSRKKLDRIISIGALSFPVAALICLTIVFVGCTSPFSPFNLYFMKVDLSDFPQLDVSAVRRSHSFGIETPRDIGPIGHLARNLVEDTKHDVATAATTGINQVSSHLDTLLNKIKAGIPEYYHVGLLGYCEGQDNILSSCSDPSTSFSFSLWGIFQSLTGNANELSASGGETYLTGNVNNTRAIISLYISAFVTAFLTLLLGVKRVFDPDGMTFPLVSSAATTILLTIATAWVICFYDFYAQHIQEVLGQYGARASLGANTIAASCLAVAFSLGSNCMNIWLIRL